jgi:hypothetical protein
MAIAFMSTSFANGNDDITNSIMNSFKQEFQNAQILNSEKFDKYIKLTFKSNDQVMFAYYTSNAELLAVTRNILSDQLPVSLLKSLKKNYAGYWITDLFKITTNDETAYYVGMENPDSTLVLVSEDGSNWQVYQKQKKGLE